ncbi:MAG: RagB/SusD family nutrient uptake outer membrane protein [Bacteroidales bacterium]|nr:RagB/SusD family nutrient uptake outer membrane protein [Bacteroidales bacterium]
MRKNILLAALLLPFGFLSCEKASFLDRKPYSTTSPENFYTRESQFKLALTGCYEVINTKKLDLSGNNYSYGTYSQGLQWIMGCPSDEIVTAKTGTVPYYMGQANFLESDAGLKQFWTAFYHGIYRCNELLDNIGRLETEEQKVQYAAEARFLRAFYYYHLAWVYGAVPVVDYPSLGKEPRMPLERVYACILDDLQYAYDNLSEKGVLTTSSANRYTAAAYIARICNYLAACKRNDVGRAFLGEQPLNDFSWVDADAMNRRALEACKDVIENSPYILIDNYSNLFRETTKADQYKECLFLSDIAINPGSGDWPASSRLAAPSGSSYTPEVYGGACMAVPKIFLMYDKEDPRRDHNFTSAMSVNSGKTMTYETIDGYDYPIPFYRSTSSAYKEWYNSDTQTYNPYYSGPCAGKYRLVKKGAMAHANSQHCISYPLMRLADVYLMAAEAEYFVSGDAAEARKYLRPVVLRAAQGDEDLCDRLMTTYGRTDFVEEILESRERELCFEMSRKYDLIRFGRIDDALLNLPLGTDILPGREFTANAKNGITAVRENWEPHKIWAPISAEQLGVNSNLTQNARW